MLNFEGVRLTVSAVSTEPTMSGFYVVQENEKKTGHPMEFYDDCRQITASFFQLLISMASKTAEINFLVNRFRDPN